MNDDAAFDSSLETRRPPHGAAQRSYRYAPVAILLHWLTAGAFAFQVGLGWRMGDAGKPGTFAAYQLHKSIGITILLLAVIRVGWRLAHPVPALTSLRPVERKLARVIHTGFYVVLLAMPLSGWLIVSTSPTTIATYLYGTVPLPHLPVPAPYRGGVNGAADMAHEWISWAALAMIALHVLGALKHQLLDRDATLGRMVPVPRSALSWFGVLLPLGLIAVMAIGRFVTNQPGTAMKPPAPVVPTKLEPKLAMSASLPPPAMSPPVTPNAKQIPVPVASASDLPAKPSSTTSSVWIIRPKGRRIGFRTAWSQGIVDGKFGVWSAAVAFDPAALDKATATVTVDLASATTAAGEQQAALSGADWFATAVHPKAIWHAAEFRHLEGDRYHATGSLTLRGITRPQAMDVTVRIEGDVASVSGSGTIDRTAFGIGQGEWASTADLPSQVRLDIAFKADRKP